MAQDILVRAENDVLHVTLNRPDDGNTVTDAMAAMLIEILGSAAKQARLLVLRGAGSVFCEGRASRGKAAKPAGGVEALQRRRQNDLIFDCYGAFRRAELPIVCVVQGGAFGFGCSIAGLSDITLAAQSATFQVPEMSHHILPTMVMSALVDRVPRKALSFLVHSTEKISAERALAFGLVSSVVPDDELDAAAARLCATMVSAPAAATQGVKDYLRTAYDMNIAGAVDYARNLHATVNSSSEMRLDK